jgi:glutathione S-transferase
MVVNSCDILSYLEDRHPRPPVYPAEAQPRTLERFYDTVLDTIVQDVSIWT